MPKKERQIQPNFAPLIDEEDNYVLQLFITGATPNSVRAITNVKEICEVHLRGKYSLEIVDVQLGTDGTYVDDLGIRCPGSQFGREQTAENAADFLPRMKGQSVIIHASRKLVEASQSVLQRNGLNASDVRWIVPHQANANLLAQVLKALRITQSDILVSILENTGNTSSASMGLALDHLRRTGQITEGDLLLMPAFGAGFMWGAALCKSVSQ